MHLPDDAWLAALAPLYAEFPLHREPTWQVTVNREPELDMAGQRWIEHDGPLTGFCVDGFAGRVDQLLLLSTPILGQATPSELARRVRQTARTTALLLAHGPDFASTPMDPAGAVKELLRTNIAAVERLASARLWMERVDQLVQALPVYRLRFRPTAELWDYLAGALALP